MNAGLINRLINLVRKTGHPVVFGDPDTGEAVAVIDLVEYERLVDIRSRKDLEPYAAQGGEGAGEPSSASGYGRAQQGSEGLVQKDVVQPSRSGISLQALLESELQTQVTPAVSKRVEPQPRSGAANLTAEASTVKINREIGGQKASQGNRTKDERPSVRTPNRPMNQPSVQQPIVQQSAPQSVAPAGQLEEEERFYLEPLE